MTAATTPEERWRPEERTPPTLRVTHWRRALPIALLAAAWALIVMVGYRGDSYGYWLADLSSLYERPWNTQWASPYSPAFHQLIAPLSALPWPVFYAAWTALIVAAGAWVVGPWAMLVLLVLPTPVRSDVMSGNIHVLLAAGMLLAVRHPAAWAIPLLTKVTPGIGAAWHLARGEWRAFGVAVGATVGIVAVSVVLMPGAWIGWGELLAASGDAPELAGMVLTVPLVYRLPVALVLVLVAGRKGWAWLLLCGVTLALPAVWWAALSIPILGTVRALTTDGRRRRSRQ